MFTLCSHLERVASTSRIDLRPGLDPPGVDHIYPNFDEHPDPSHRSLYLAQVLKILAELPRGAKILDAGCGGGDFAVGLAEAGYEIYGCDLNESAIAAANRRGIGTFKCASLYESLTEPFGVDAFDAIVSVEVIEHLYSPYSYVRQGYDALRPGGLFIVTTPYWGYWKNLALAVTNRTDGYLTALWEGGHIKHFSRKTLTRLFNDCGFTEAGFQGAGETPSRRIPYLWSGMVMTFRKPAG